MTLTELIPGARVRAVISAQIDAWMVREGLTVNAAATRLCVRPRTFEGWRLGRPCPDALPILDAMARYTAAADAKEMAELEAMDSAEGRA